MWKFLSNLDQSLFFALNSRGMEGFDSFFACLSYSGRPQILLITVIPFILLLSKKHRLLRGGGFVLIILIADTCSGFLKIFFDRARPFVTFENEFSNGTLRLVDMFGVSDTPSFPSGHATLAFAVAFYLYRLYGPGLGWVYAGAVAIGFSRIYLGVHYPGDILGGIIAGSMIGWLVIEALRKFFPGAVYKTEQP